MADLSTGTKHRLTITRCVVVGGHPKPLSGDENAFALMLNPSEYKHGHSISYSTTSTQGQNGKETRFAGIDAEKVSFETVIDGTGVIDPPPPGAGYPDVNTQIDKLRKVIYLYDGMRHEPPVVRLSWGSLDLSGFSDTAKFFYGRLDSLQVNYTMFRPSGEPLRARVSMDFTSFTTMKEAQLRANRSSPDLSHLVEVRDGDTLPLLCQRIYDDSRQHIRVARENGLSNFRDLAPGTLLRFPPLD